MQLVLHGGKKVACDWGVFVVVGREGVDVGDLLVEATLTGADLTNALQQFIEVILAKLLALFQALVVHHEALSHKSEIEWLDNYLPDNQRQ